MWGKILKGTAKFAVGMAVSVIFDDDSSLSDEEKKNKRQLDQLSDGFGGVIADGEHMTRQEAEDAQSRGELYDTYY